MTATRQRGDSYARTTIRFDPGVLALVDAYAARTRRSRNAAVNQLIETALAIDTQNPERPPP